MSATSRALRASVAVGARGALLAGTWDALAVAAPGSDPTTPAAVAATAALSAASACVAAGCVALGARAALGAAEALRGRPRTRRWAPLPLALPAFAACALLQRRLFDTALLARHADAATTAVVAVAAALACWFAAAGIARVAAAAEAGRSPVLRRVGAAFVVVAALAADRVVEPFRFPNAHALLWGVAFLALAVAAAAPTAPWTRRGRIAGAVLCAGALAITAAGPSLADGRTLFAAQRESQWARLVVLRTGGLRAERAPDPTARVEEEAAAPIDPSTLDRAVPGRRDLNVLLLTMDALRTDRLGASRDGRPLTPRLSALAAESCLLTEAWSSYPSTGPAFAALFTGRDTGALVRRRDARRPGAPPPEPTLAEILGAAGRRTEALLGLPRARAELDFRETTRGFDAVNAFEAEGGSAPPFGDDAALAREAVRALDRAAGRPFFLWVHLFGPHAPYQAWEDPNFGPKDVDRYDAEILRSDGAAGVVLDALRERGLAARTAVIVAADHGESFGEHGETHHGRSLFRTQTNVPVLLRIPGVAAGRSAIPADFTTLLPTLAELLGVAAPAGARGRSLLPVLLGLPDGSPRTAFAELASDDEITPRRQFALRDGRYKVVEDVPSGRVLLFDATADPGEERDLASRDPATASRLLRALDARRNLSRAR